MPDDDIVAWLEKHDRQMRRDFKACQIKAYRYLTRTTPEQMQADMAAYDRAVLERGWHIPKKDKDDA
jgi:hypothetical protein